jgi:hypothetical protein
MYKKGIATARDTQKDLEKTNSIYDSTLLSYLKGLQSRNIFIIADACFSGSLFVSDAEVAYQGNNDKLEPI